AHPVGLLGAVFESEKEDLPSPLLAHHPGEVGGPESAVKAGHVSVGLLEAGLLTAGDGQVAHHMEAVAAAGGPTGDDADHDLRHESDQPLHLKDVEPSRPARV